MASECAAMQTSKGGSHDPTSEFGSLWHLASTSPLQPVNIIAKSVFLFFFPRCNAFSALQALESCKALGSLWSDFIRLCQSNRYIRVEVRRYASKAIFEAKGETFISKH